MQSFWFLNISYHDGNFYFFSLTLNRSLTRTLGTPGPKLGSTNSPPTLYQLTPLENMLKCPFFCFLCHLRHEFTWCRVVRGRVWLVPKKSRSSFSPIFCVQTPRHIKWFWFSTDYWTMDDLSILVLVPSSAYNFFSSPIYTLWTLLNAKVGQTWNSVMVIILSNTKKTPNKNGHLSMFSRGRVGSG